MLEEYIISFGLGFIISMFIFSYIGTTLVDNREVKIKEFIEKNNTFYEINGKLHKIIKNINHEIQILKEQLKNNTI